MKNPNLFIPFLLMSIIKINSQTDTLRFSTVNIGQITGKEKNWKVSDHEYATIAYFNDRGRGSIDTIYVKTNAMNKMIQYSARGLDYYKAPYTSSFNPVGDSLITTYNSKRTGYKDSGQYYTAGLGYGTGTAIIRQLESNGNQNITLTGDTMFLKNKIPYTVKFKNAETKIWLYYLQMSNDPEPLLIWQDDQNNFFGYLGEWTSKIRQGFESKIDELLTFQNKQTESYYSSVYKRLSSPFPEKLAITHVRIFNAEKSTTDEDKTLWIEHGMITRISQSSNQIPKDFTILDGKNKTILPGLWDTHSHYDKSNGADYLSGGITLIRDMGNSNTILQWQDQIKRHAMMGPDLSYLSGFIDKNDEFHGPAGKIINNLTEGIEAVRFYARNHYNQIKLYSSIDTGWIRPMASEAHKLGMRVAGHIPWHYTASQAILAGYDEITHINMVMFNFFPDTIDTRQNRFKPIGRSAYTIDLQSNESKKFLHLLDQHHTVIEPTLHVFDDMLNTFPGDTSGSLKPVLSWLPEKQKQDIANASFIDDPAWIPSYKKSYERILQMTRLLYDHGVTLLCGTDGGNQYALHHELELFVKAGIPDHKVLSMATWNPVKVFRLGNRYGKILPGRVADIILIDGKPDKNISDIRKVYMVVTNQSLFYPKKIYESYQMGYYY